MALPAVSASLIFPVTARGREGGGSPQPARMASEWMTRKNGFHSSARELDEFDLIGRSSIHRGTPFAAKVATILLLPEKPEPGCMERGLRLMLLSPLSAEEELPRCILLTDGLGATRELRKAAVRVLSRTWLPASEVETDIFSERVLRL